jgi:hypothetical protein
MGNYYNGGPKIFLVKNSQPTKAGTTADMGVESGYCSRVLQGFEDLIPGKKSNTR